MFKALFFVAALALTPASAFAQSVDNIAGGWRFQMQYDGVGYVGVLRIDSNRQPANATITILGTDGAVVTERAHVTVSGATITIDGYEIVSANTDWIPDNFSLTLQGNRLVGQSLDDQGGFGAPVEFTR